MLAVFKNGLVEAPKELHSTMKVSAGREKNPEEALREFLASNPENSLSLGFVGKAILAYSPPTTTLMSHQRQFCGVNDVYCIFLGNLNNLCTLNKQYGLSKNANEPMFAIKAYQTLRDRSPMPAYRVLQDLEGSFGFVIYDHKNGTVFIALGGDKSVNLFWGISSSDGSVMVSESVEMIKACCRKSFGPFPAGCMYHTERGLMSYEHPMHKMKAMPRVDSEGSVCGAYFAVDAYTKTNTMPRVGSEANWATWGA